MRWHIATREGLGLVRSIIFRQMIWRKWPLTAAAFIIGIGQRMLFGIGPKNPVRYLFPLFGVSKRRNFPKMAIKTGQSLYPEVVRAKNGPAKMRVGYFIGCAGNLIYTNVVRSIVEILTYYGYEVIIPKAQKCNGTPVLANGDYEGARLLMEFNYHLFNRYNLDAIVVACSSCGMALKNEIKAFIEHTEGLEEFTSKVFDINEFINNNIGPKAEDLGKLPYRVTYHDPCHMVRGQGIAAEPRNILKKIPGVEFKEMKDAAVCCGSAGSYCITHYETAIKIDNHKVRNIMDAEVDVVATGCPTCVMHIQDNLIQHQTDEKMRFVVEILADSMRAAGKIK